jgi:glucose-6-phosphate 1-dehydrogenase
MSANVEVRARPSEPAGVPPPEAVRAEDPVTLVIFGASGDLGKRRLIPALYHLQSAGCLPERFAVVGFSRSPLSDASV